MESELVKLIIEKFFEYLKQLSKRCCICFDKCLIRFVSRQYIDTFVIEVYYKTLSDNAYLGDYLPLPLVTIDFTYFNICYLQEGKYNKYIKEQALKFLNLIQASRHNLIDNVCCDCEDSDSPINCCNCVYREEFTLCPEPEPCCPDRPYDDWCKPCRKKKLRCRPYCEPKCPIKICDFDNCRCNVVEEEPCLPSMCRKRRCNKNPIRNCAGCPPVPDKPHKCGCEKKKHHSDSIKITHQEHTNEKKCFAHNIRKCDVCNSHQGKNCRCLKCVEALLH